MIVKLICQEEHTVMLENILFKNHIAINDEAEILVVEKNMAYEDKYHLVIVFNKYYLHTLINTLQGLCQEDLQTNMLMGKLGDAWVPINVDDIVYISAQGNDTYANLDLGRSIKIKYKLYQLEEIILSKNYIRINKSEIVNIKKIKSISPMFGGNLLIYLEGYKTALDISRNYVKDFKERMGIR